MQNVVVDVVEAENERSGVENRMETAAVVFEHDFDAETLAEVKSLRMIRLCLAEKQLANISETLTQMVDRGLVQKADEKKTMEELSSELKSKITVLRSRTSSESNAVYLDEIEFYLKLVTEE